jgi:hypothetical protein
LQGPSYSVFGCCCVLALKCSADDCVPPLVGFVLKYLLVPLNELNDNYVCEDIGMASSLTELLVH